MNKKDIENSQIDKTLDHLEIDNMYSVQKNDLNFLKEDEMKKKKKIL